MFFITRFFLEHIFSLQKKYYRWLLLTSFPSLLPDFLVRSIMIAICSTVLVFFSAFSCTEGSDESSTPETDTNRCIGMLEEDGSCWHWLQRCLCCIVCCDYLGFEREEDEETYAVAYDNIIYSEGERDSTRGGEQNPDDCSTEHSLCDEPQDLSFANAALSLSDETSGECLEGGGNGDLTVIQSSNTELNEQSNNLPNRLEECEQSDDIVERHGAASTGVNGSLTHVERMKVLDECAKILIEAKRVCNN